MAVLRARSTVLVSGDSICFHLDYTHFFKFQSSRESVCVCLRVTFQPSLSVFEPADQGCLHWEPEQTSVIACISCLYNARDPMGCRAAQRNYKQRSFLMIRLSS